jgi:hypothetical protein
MLLGDRRDQPVGVEFDRGQRRFDRIAHGIAPRGDCLSFLAATD